MSVSAPGEAPPGMPAHLWEAAKRDVRGVIPDWLRSAKDNGADAPAHIREVARRAARAGAGLGVAIAVGGAASAVDTPTVALSARTTELEPTGLDHLGAVPAPAPDDPVLAESFRVADPLGTHDGLLNVEMYQDVVVNEDAGAVHHVDAFQFLVIRDSTGREYVFKEHHHAALPDPPARETDLLIHERGQVHVVENPDGSFSMDTVGYDRLVQAADEHPTDTDPGVAPVADPAPEPPAPATGGGDAPVLLEPEPIEPEPIEPVPIDHGPLPIDHPETAVDQTNDAAHGPDHDPADPPDAIAFH